MGDAAAIAKAAAAVLLFGGIVWVVTSGPTSCPLPSGEPPGRIAALGDDGVLWIHQRVEGGTYAQMGDRPGVLSVQAAWFSWLVAEPTRIVRAGDTGLELASVATPPVRAMAIVDGNLWVATDGNLTGYDENLQPLGRLAVPVARPTGLTMWNGTLLVQGEGEMARVDVTQPYWPGLVDLDPADLPAPGNRWAFVPYARGDAVARVDSAGETLCRSSYQVQGGRTFHDSGEAVLGAVGNEVQLLRRDGAKPLLSIPAPVAAIAAQ